MTARIAASFARRRGRPACAAFVVAMSTAEHAAAEDALVVHRSPQAADCPDAHALSRSIRSMTPKAPAAADELADKVPQETIEVAFDRNADSYRVQIRMGGARAGVRELEDANAHCASLSQAAAFTIALLLDPDAALPVPSRPEKRTVEPQRAQPIETRWSVAAEAGGGVTLGIVRPVAPVGYALANVSPHPRVSFGIGGAIVPTQSLQLERGNVDVGLLAAQGRVCVYPVARTVQVGACGGVVAGALRAAGRGYPIDGASDRFLFGATVEAIGSGPLVGALGWSVRLGGFVPLPRQKFGIEGAGVAYEPSPVGGLFSVGATLTFR